MTREEELELRIKELERRTYKLNSTYDAYLKTWLEGTNVSDILYYDSKVLYNKYLLERSKNYDTDGLEASISLFNRYVRYQYPDLDTFHVSKGGVSRYVWLPKKQ